MRDVILYGEAMFECDPRPLKDVCAPTGKGLNHRGFPAKMAKNSNDIHAQMVSGAQIVASAHA